MSKLSDEQLEMARDFEHLIFQYLSSAGQKYTAEAVNMSESAISRMKSEPKENSKDTEIQRFCKILSYIGLQIVPANVQCHPAKYIEALQTLAEVGIKAENKRPRKLGWD